MFYRLEPQFEIMSFFVVVFVFFKFFVFLFGQVFFYDLDDR